MKIGLDYGGVISFAPDGWAKSIKKAISQGHEVFLVSHVQPEQKDQLQMRTDFVAQAGAINLTFSDLDWYSQKELVAHKKAKLCIEYNIELFIDDDLFICQEVSRMCNRCAVLYIPITLWQIGQRLIDGLTEDW